MPHPRLTLSGTCHPSGPSPPTDGVTPMITNNVLDVAVRDGRLSFRALGVLAHLVVEPCRSVQELASRGPGREGRLTLNTAVKELETRGYLRREGAGHAREWVLTVPQDAGVPA